MYRLVPTVRGGATNSPLVSAKYSTIDEARSGAKELIHENGRVIRVMIVEGAPGRFVEWIERAG
jgi:hypothetical protein